MQRYSGTSLKYEFKLFVVCSKITAINTFGVTMSGRFSWIWKDFICLPKSLPIYFQISPDNLQKKELIKELINFLESKIWTTELLNYWKDLWKWLPAFTGERNCILILQQERRWLIKSMQGWFQASLLYSWIYGLFPILELKQPFCFWREANKHIFACAQPHSCKWQRLMQMERTLMPLPAACANGDAGRHSPATSTARVPKGSRQGSGLRPKGWESLV